MAADVEPCRISAFMDERRLPEAILKCLKVNVDLSWTGLLLTVFT
jgi:hypothetical protein